MALSCPAIADAGGSLLQSLAGYIDCNAQSLGQSGFAGALPPAFLASCLTIYVALIGYRFLLGQPLDARDAVLAALRVGLVITLCTSWPAFETLAYRVAIDGPGEVAGGVLGGQAPDAGELARRAQEDFDAIQAGFHPQQAGAAQDGSSSAPLAASPTPYVTVRSLPPPNLNGAPSLNQSGEVFFVTTLGAFLAARLVAGIFLALGPLIIALALFDTTLGLVEGWIRALVGAVLATAGISIVTALELTFIEAQLPLPPPNPLAGQGLLLVAAVFAVAIVAVVAAAGLAARGLRFPARTARPVGQLASPALQPPPDMRSASIFSDRREESISRTQRVVDAIAAQGRRERMDGGEAAEGLQGRRATRAVRRPDGGQEGVSLAPLGHSLRRTPSARRSATVSRRESRR